MSKPEDDRLPDELQALEQRLREERRWAEDTEIDGIKLRAMRRAQRRTSKVAPLRARLSTAVLTLALVGGGGGAVIAADGGGNGNGNGNGAANSQYCPPKSPGAGKPKNPPPGNACGQPNQGNAEVRTVARAPDQDRVGGDRDDGPSTGNRADDADAEGGDLPFTGLSLLALFAAGLALIIAGRTLRGRTQR